MHVCLKSVLFAFLLAPLAARAEVEFGKIEHCAELQGFYQCEAGGSDDGRFDHLKIEVDQYLGHTITLKNGTYVFMGPGKPRKLVFTKSKTLKPDGIPRADVVESASHFDTLARQSCLKGGRFETIDFSVARNNPGAVATLRRLEITGESLDDSGKHTAVRVVEAEGYVGLAERNDRQYLCRRVAELPQKPVQ